MHLVWENVQNLCALLVLPFLLIMVLLHDISLQESQNLCLFLSPHVQNTPARETTSILQGTKQDFTVKKYFPKHLSCFNYIILKTHTLQLGRVSGNFRGGGLNRLQHSIMCSLWLMSLAFFCIWLTRDSNFPMALKNPQILMNHDQNYSN